VTAALSLRPYQVAGRDFLASRRFALLADEMRVGKTPQAIRAADAIGAEKVLVVCPAIAVPQWRTEFARWSDRAGLPLLEVVSYDMAKRRSADLLRPQWNVVIVDECHFAKNPDAQRTRLIYGKEGLGWHTERMWALSGTPAPKHAAELWPMLRAFGVTCMDYNQFVSRYCRVDWFSGKPVGTKEKHVPELRELLGKIMLRRTRKQVAPDMPTIGFSFLNVELSATVDLAFSGDPEANPLADLENRMAVANAKALPLVEHIELALANGLLKQTVVFGWHVEPLRRVSEALRQRGIAAVTITGATSQAVRSQLQSDFKRGRLQVLVANVLAAGTAIDLSVASHGYFLELDWLPGTNVQAANRLVSLDKKEPVTFDICTSPGTVDDRIQKILLRRATELATIYA